MIEVFKQKHTRLAGFGLFEVGGDADTLPKREISATFPAQRVFETSVSLFARREQLEGGKAFSFGDGLVVNTMYIGTAPDSQ